MDATLLILDVEKLIILPLMMNIFQACTLVSSYFTDNSSLRIYIQPTGIFFFIQHMASTQ
jgi:hypothetical protein